MKALLVAVVLDDGHFALDEATGESAGSVRASLDRTIARPSHLAGPPWAR